jgi:hypothetical protein
MAFTVILYGAAVRAKENAIQASFPVKSNIFLSSVLCILTAS